MTSWKTYKLGDVCSRLRSGKGIPASEVSACGKFAVVGGNGVRGYTDKSNFNGQCVVVGRQGAYCGNVRYFDGEFYMTEHAVVIVGNELADTHFLAYLLSTMHLGQLSAQSAQPGLSVQTLSKLEISLPSLEEQRRIAGILGAIDDKIENNRRINTNLELQAQALYKQWFVDNRSDDWEEKQLGEIALHITDGVHNTVTDSQQGEYYLLSCKNIKRGQLFIGSNERRIDQETFARLRKRTRLSQGDILVTSVGTVGEMYLVNEIPANYEFQRSVAIIKPNQSIISSYFLYSALLYLQNEIKHLAHGAVQQCIFISDLKEYSLIVPNKDDISAFDAIVAPVFNKIGELQKENETLATLRDTLLPKLMNGEIKI